MRFVGLGSSRVVSNIGISSFRMYVRTDLLMILHTAPRSRKPDPRKSQISRAFFPAISAQLSHKSNHAG